MGVAKAQQSIAITILSYFLNNYLILKFSVYKKSNQNEFDSDFDTCGTFSRVCEISRSCCAQWRPTTGGFHFHGQYSSLFDKEDVVRGCCLALGTCDNRPIATDKWPNHGQKNHIDLWCLCFCGFSNGSGSLNFLLQGPFTKRISSLLVLETKVG